MKRVAASAHFSTPWLFEPAKRPDDKKTTFTATNTQPTKPVESRYNVSRLQRIQRYNVLLPRSRFHVMENSQSEYNVLSPTPLGVRCNASFNP